MHRCLPILTRLACIVVLGFGIAARADDETGTVRGKVVDEAGQPVTNVEIKLHEWRGEYESVPHVVRSDEAGQFEFPEIKTGYPLILVQDDRFATVGQSFSLEAAETRELELQVAEGVRSHLLITDPEGNSLPGARMREFGMQSPVNGLVYFRGLSFEQVGFPQPSSDADGRLQLPPVPAGTVVSVIVAHDDWAATQQEDIEVQAGLCGTVALQTGARIEFLVSPSPDVSGDLEGMTLAIDLRSEPFDVESSLISVPRTVHQQRFHVCLQPGAYRSLRFLHDDVVVTPQFMRREAIQVERDKNASVLLLVRPALPVRGQLVDTASHSPIADQEFLIETQNLAPDGSVVLDGTEPWAFLGWAQTDANGEFVAKLPPGRGRISLRSPGFVTKQAHYEITVAADQENRFPQIVAGKPPAIIGKVLDGDGHPLPDAIVRIASRLLRTEQPVRSDHTGRFRIQPPAIPVDFMTGERVMGHSIVAYMPHDNRCAVQQVNLNPEDFSSIELVMTLSEHPPGWLLEALSSEMTNWERGQPPEDSKSRINPQAQRGRRPPALDCREWLNVEYGEDSLDSFRGKYVLLDFWATWCGPCLADAPSLEMIHKLYGDRITVIGVHDNSVPLKEIREFVDKHKVPYPIAIDQEDGRTFQAYENAGIMGGYPSYVLLDSEGKVIACDRAIPAPTLRSYKVEWVRQVLLEDGGQ